MAKRLIFEREIEVGYYRDNLQSEQNRETPHPSWAIVAHTVASVVETQSTVLRIEQRCYLRQDRVVHDQPWVKSEIILEHALGAEAELINRCRQRQEQSIRKIRQQFPIDSLLLK